MATPGELASFLRARRAELRPALRREELAHLAGVSLAYYTRIEQGRSTAAAEGVIEAIARVLCLTEAERMHLHGIARARPAEPATPVSERVRPSLYRLVAALDGVAAAVLGRSLDVLAWNRLAHALVASHLDFAGPARPAARPNLARLAFLDPHARELYVDWHERTRDVAAYLRARADRYPDDARLTALVGELSIRSRRFGALWASRSVRGSLHGRVRLRHPVVGSLDLVDETLELPELPDQVVLMLAADGSTAEASVRRLEELTARDRPKRASAPGRPGRPSAAAAGAT
jgi:transcriptional regulator with XRE-family HTH domain